MSQIVRKGEELNEVSLKSFLLENQLISSFNNELLVEQYSNGFSNLTYLLKIDNK